MAFSKGDIPILVFFLVIRRLDYYGFQVSNGLREGLGKSFLMLGIFDFGFQGVRQGIWGVLGVTYRVLRAKSRSLIILGVSYPGFQGIREGISDHTRSSGCKF